MRIEKFKLNKEFRRLYGRGKSLVSPYIVTYALRGKSENVRIGITVGKKLGNAVCRNRAKRLIVAAFNSIKDDVLPHSEIVFVARTRILGVKSTEVAVCMKQHLSQLGFLKQ